MLECLIECEMKKNKKNYLQRQRSERGRSGGTAESSKCLQTETEMVSRMESKGICHLKICFAKQVVGINTKNLTCLVLF